MDDYKPNSYKYKAEQAAEKPKVEKVVSGKVKRVKKTEASKFKDVFISEDVSNVKNYIFMDVLVPALKKAVSDIITNGIDMLLYGDTARTKSRSAGSTVSYRKYYDSRDDRRRDTISRYSYDDITLEDRAEAERVLRQMDDLIDTYKVVSVADLYDLVGIEPKYTDNKYGWTNLRNAEAIRLRDGSFMLKLPKALPLN